MKANSIRFTISVLYTGILGIILLAYSLLLYATLSYFISSEINAKLHKKVDAIESMVAQYATILEPDHEITPISLKRVINRIDSDRAGFFESPRIKRLDKEWQYTLHELGLKNDYVVVFYPTGEIMERSDNIEEFIMPLLEECQAFIAFPEEDVITNIESENSALRVIVRPSYSDEKLRHVMVLATSIEPLATVVKLPFAIIFLTIPVVLIVTSFLGRFFVIRTLQPIKEIAETANTISHKDMSKRVDVKLMDAEIIALENAFNDMIRRLEKSFTYIEEFSSNVAHELKTPLAIIRGEAEVTLRKERPGEDYKRVIEITLEEVERMLKIIDDLLLLTKLDYQAAIITFESVEVNEFLTEIFEQAKIIAAQKNILVRFECPDAAAHVTANKLHLRRLFLNLIDNAIKFTSTEGFVDICASCNQTQAHISIRDTGVGIAPEDLERIYSRFYHLDKTSWDNPPSSGLGLSIVQSIVRMHNGSVEVTSEVGIGTTFTVLLPLANAAKKDEV